MDKDISIGIDIGGTKVHLGLVDRSGKVIDDQRLPVQIDLGAEASIKTICGHLDRLIESNQLKKSDILSFGVGVPGTADIKTGNVEYCPNLGWEDVPAGAIFGKYLERDVIVSQDSRCAAWAEYLLGAGRKYQSMICLTLGTGIGSGIIMDGRIFHGALNTAGEIGHCVFEKDGRPCNCGRRGCLERYCSGTGIIQRALEAFPEKLASLPHKSESVFQLAYGGDQDALTLIRAVVEDLAIGIANAVSILSPQAVIISGGLCEHYELIVSPLEQLVNQYGYHSWSRKKMLKIEKAQAGSDAPMIGAALLYKALK
ncbi:MAG: ROK family protein [Chloroflexi bacterium]|nr:ROK family protein [Chloroflexota bacterium]